MGVVIRAARQADREGCLALVESLTGTAPDARTRRVYAELLEGARGEVLVAEAEEQTREETGVLLGTATVSYNVALRYRGEYCQLEELIVSSAARGQNVGGRLVEALVERARERGCAEVGLYLLESTEHNRPFYEKYGFLSVGREMRLTL